MSLTPATQEAYRLLHDGALAMARVSEEGLHIDVPYLDKAIKDVRQTMLEKKEALKQTEEWRLWLREFGSEARLNGRKQLGHIIFDVQGHKRNPYLGQSNDRKAFEHLNLPFIHAYQEVQKLRKSLTTNLLGIRRETIDGICHPNCNLGIAESYRSTYSDPNFQNQPGRDKTIAKIVRSCVVPKNDKYVYLEADYSTQEVRVSYCYNKDPTLLHDIFHGDMHRDRAMELYKLSADELGPTGSGTTGKDIRYCNPPEAPIWMADMTFKPIGEIKVGDEVMGWERVSVDGNITKRSKKRLVKSKVLAVHTHEAEIVKLFMQSGRKIRCTPDHLWADGDWPYNNEKEVYTTPRVGKCLAHIVDPTTELPESLQYDAGYFGAMMDAEGTARLMVVSQSWKTNKDVCLRLEETAKKLGFGYKWRGNSHANGCLQMYLQGGLSTRVKLLNHCKPAKKDRLIQSIMERTNFGSKDRIDYIQPDGHGKVIGLTTTSGNYIAWGYASKNCAKNMFVFREFYGGVYFQAAPDLWDAIGQFDLKRTDGQSLYRHLKRKGIKELGACDSTKEPVKGTFEYHVKKVEQQMWEGSYPVYADWKRKWWNQYLRDGGVNTLTGFRQEGVFRRNQILCDSIQGSAFHCLLWTLIQCQKEFRQRKMRSRIVLQIHDSMLIHTHRNEIEEVVRIIKRVGVKDIAEHWKWIACPLDIDFEICEESWWGKVPLEMKA